MLIQAWTRLDGCRQSAAGAAKVHPLSHLNDDKLTSQPTEDSTCENYIRSVAFYNYNRQVNAVVQLATLMSESIRGGKGRFLRFWFFMVF